MEEKGRLPQWLRHEESTCQCRRCRRLRFDPWVRKIPWRRKWQPIPVFLPAESPWTEEPGGLQSLGVTKSQIRLKAYHSHTQKKKIIIRLTDNFSFAILMLQDNKETPTEHFGWKLLRCKLHFTNDRGGGGLVAKSCPTLWDPMDCSPQGSSVHGISRQEYWSGLPFPSPGLLPNPGVEPKPPAL